MNLVRTQERPWAKLHGAIQSSYQDMALAELSRFYSMSLRTYLGFQILCLGAMSPWKYSIHGFRNKLPLIPKHLPPKHAHNNLSFDDVKQAGT